MRKKKPVKRAECPICGEYFRQRSQHTKVCSVECRFVLYANQSAPDVCWEWSGPKSFDGYGRLFLEQNYETGKRMSVAAHRYSYEAHHAVAIPEAMCAMHKCDNPACVNPYHMALGTWADNNADRSAKGRSGKRVFSDDDKAKYSAMNRGSSNNASKLTEADVRFLKYESGNLSNREVATRLGISYAVVQSVRTGRSWKHV